MKIHLLVVLVAISFSAFAQTPTHFEGRYERSQRLEAIKGQACSGDDVRVGNEAGLRRRAHGVSGTARIVDNCTIMIDEFNYDGGGVDVRVYGFTNQSFDGGVSLSEDLRRDTPYVNETLTVGLPDGVTLDDAAVISIWCVPLATSFGDGEFVEPGMQPEPMDSGCPAAASGTRPYAAQTGDIALMLLAALVLAGIPSARAKAWRAERT